MKPSFFDSYGMLEVGTLAPDRHPGYSMFFPVGSTVPCDGRPYEGQAHAYELVSIAGEAKIGSCLIFSPKDSLGPQDPLVKSLLLGSNQSLVRKPEFDSADPEVVHGHLKNNELPKEFCVAAVTPSTTGEHSKCVLVAEDGTSFKADGSKQTQPGQVVSVTRIGFGILNFCRAGFDSPVGIKESPDVLVEAVWKKAIRPGNPVSEGASLPGRGKSDSVEPARAGREM